MTSHLQRQLLASQRHFQKACEQFAILDRQLEELSARFREADATGHRILRYNIRLRMSVTEGVRNMFYEFAAIKSTEVIELQRSVLVEASQEGSDSEASDLSGDDSNFRHVMSELYTSFNGDDSPDENADPSDVIPLDR